MKKLWFALLAVMLWAAPVVAQEELTISKIYLGTQPCQMLSGSGSPESVVTAKVCSTYYRTDTGGVYAKTSGTGNTGWTLLLTSVSSAALTKSDDTNVTLTLGGSPTTALLAATSITAGWTGQLSLARGGTNANLSAVNGGVAYSGASAMAFTAAGSAGQRLQSNGAGAPTWTTATFPGTASGTGKILRADGTNWVASTPTYPNTAVANKLLRGDGTNWVESTPTFPNTATSGKLLRADGTNWAETTATFPATATGAGTFLRADGTNWAASTLILPNAATSGRVVFASTTNTYGEDSDLTFNTDTLSATKIIASSAGHFNPTAADLYDLGTFSYPWRRGVVTEMVGTVFVKATQTLYGGWLTVTKNAGTFAAAVTAAATSIDFGQAMTPGQFLITRALDNTGTARTERFTVGTLVSGTTYNVTRHDTGRDWVMGTPYAVRGVSGDGWVELQAYDTPRLSVWKQGAAYDAVTEYVRLGSLDGFLGIAAGKVGLAIGDASQNVQYFDGSLALTGTINALAGYFGNASTDVAITSEGLNVGSTGNIRGGQTGYNTGTGFWMGYDAGAYKLSFGNASDKALTWDGSNLLIGASAGTHATIDSTNGFRIRRSGTTDVFTAKPDGTVLIQNAATGGAPSLRLAYDDGSTGNYTQMQVESNGTLHIITQGIFYDGLPGTAAGQFNFKNAATLNWLDSGGVGRIALAWNASDELYLANSKSGGTVKVKTGAPSVDALIIDQSQNVSLKATGKLYLDGGGNTYLTEGSADDVSVYVGGSRYLQMTAAQFHVQSADLLIPAAKKFYLDGGGNSYLWEAGADDVRFVVNATDRLIMNANGTQFTNVDLLMSATKRLYLDGGYDTYLTEISGNRVGLYVGGVLAGDVYNNDIYFVSAYDTTTGASANMVVGAAGRLMRSTSSIRYKTDVTPITLGEARRVALGLRGVTYRGTSRADDGRLFAGFIAEDVGRLTPLLVTYDADGATPNYVTYDRVPAYLVPVVQDHDARIADLEREIAALRALLLKGAK